MRVYIVKEQAIAFLKEINTLAITDLHIGLELELRKKGIKIFPQVKKFIDVLKKTREETGAKKLVILGDIKHKVPGSSISEIREVKWFLDEVSKIFNIIIICKGNHDDRIENIVDNSRIKVYGSRGVKIRDYGFFHAHAWPFAKLWNAKVWIVGHLQALFEVQRGNTKELKRVVIKGKPRINKGKLEEIIVLPSFNEFLGGMIINKENKLEGLLFKIFDPPNTYIYLLDGTEVCKLSELYL
ncbi:MAG: metallophosphoesterase [Candidatus Aenigmatarchaeota archaeon]